MLVAKVQVSGIPVAKGQVSIMLVATADKLRLYRCSSPRERYDANFCNLVLAFFHRRPLSRQCNPASQVDLPPRRPLLVLARGRLRRRGAIWHGNPTPGFTFERFPSRETSAQPARREARFIEATAVPS
jgi:hypothetical protein